MMAIRIAMALASLLFATTASAQNSIGEPGRGADTPNPLKNVYFGEQHMHTVNSPDAFAFGTRNTPDASLVVKPDIYYGLQPRLP